MHGRNKTASATAIYPSSLEGPSTSQLSTSQEMVLLRQLCWAAWTPPFCATPGVSSSHQGLLKEQLVLQVVQSSHLHHEMSNRGRGVLLKCHTASSSPVCTAEELGPEEIKGC